jgi:hypothetical protein
VQINVIEKMVNKFLCAFNLDLHKSMFKMAMKNNAQTTFGPFNIINLLTKMWKLIIDFLIFFITFQNMLNKKRLP